MFSGRRVLGVSSMSSCDEDGFARLQTIENGTLVHYMAAEPFRAPRGGARARHRTHPPDDVMDKIREEERSQNGGDLFAVTEKTIYCADRDAVQKAVLRAMDAQEHINQLQKDGKMAGYGSPA